MDEDILYGVAAVVAVFFGGLTVFVPVLALTLRVALRPVLDTWSRIRQGQGADERVAVLARKMDMMEIEMQEAQRALAGLQEAQHFQQALASPPANHRQVEANRVASPAPLAE